MAKQLVVIGGSRDQFLAYCKHKDRKPKKQIHAKRVMQIRDHNFDHAKVIVMHPGTGFLDQVEHESMLNYLHRHSIVWRRA